MRSLREKYPQALTLTNQKRCQVLIQPKKNQCKDSWSAWELLQNQIQIPRLAIPKELLSPLRQEETIRKTSKKLQYKKRRWLHCTRFKTQSIKTHSHRQNQPCHQSAPQKTTMDRTWQRTKKFLNGTLKTSLSELLLMNICKRKSTLLKGSKSLRNSLNPHSCKRWCKKSSVPGLRTKSKNKSIGSLKRT